MFDSLTKTRLRPGILSVLLMVFGLVACDASTSVAQSAASEIEETGFIEGTVGEATGRWVTFRQSFEGESSSTSNFSSPAGMMTSYTLQGHETTRFAIKNSVSVSFTLMNGALVESGVNYFHTDNMRQFYGDHEGSVTVQLSSVDNADGVARVAGTVKGRVYRMEGMTAEVVPSDFMDIDLQFEATAFKE